MHTVYDHVCVFCVCIFLKGIFIVFLKINSGNNFLPIARKGTDFFSLENL